MTELVGGLPPIFRSPAVDPPPAVGTRKHLFRFVTSAIGGVTFASRLAQVQTSIKEIVAAFASRYSEVTPSIVDELLEDETYLAACARFAEVVAGRKPPRPKPPSPQSTASELERRGLALQYELRQARCELRERNERKDPTLPLFIVDTKVSEQRARPLWFVYEPGIPSEISEALLGMRRSEAARFLLSAKSWNTTNAEILRGRWVAALVEYARFVAGIPQISIPSLAPFAPLDVPALAARHAATNERFRVLAETARRELAA